MMPPTAPIPMMQTSGRCRTIAAPPARGFLTSVTPRPAAARLLLGGERRPVPAVFSSPPWGCATRGRGRTLEAETPIPCSPQGLIRRGTVPLLLRRVLPLHAGISEQAPADEVAIASMRRIAEHPLAYVHPQQVEELLGGGRREARRRAGLEVAQHSVLLLLREVAEGGAVAGLAVGVQSREAGAVNLLQGDIGAGQRAVDVEDDAGFARAWPQRVGGDHARRDGIDRAALRRVEEQEVLGGCGLLACDGRRLMAVCLQRGAGHGGANTLTGERLGRDDAGHRTGPCRRMQEKLAACDLASAHALLLPRPTVHAAGEPSVPPSRPIVNTWKGSLR